MRGSLGPRLGFTRRFHGIAIGCYLEGGGSGPRENVRLDLETDGSISVYVGSSSVGQGVETVFAQIAADALERPIEAIHGVYHGSLPQDSLNFRWRYWVASARLVRQHPLAGVGVGPSQLGRGDRA